jgi:hypothetical protein
VLMHAFNTQFIFHPYSCIQLHSLGAVQLAFPESTLSDV